MAEQLGVTYTVNTSVESPSDFKITKCEKLNSVDLVIESVGKEDALPHSIVTIKGEVGS
jgi:hypothetical protein